MRNLKSRSKNSFLFKSDDKRKSIRYYLKYYFHFWWINLICLITTLIIGICVSHFSFPQTYTSKGFFGVNKDVHENVYRTLIDVASSNSVALETYEYLKENNVKHSSDNEITFKEIKSGIMCDYVYSILRVEITFTNSDSTIVEKVLKTVMDSSILHLDDSTKYPIKEHIFIDEYPINFVENLNPFPFVMFSSLIGGLGIGILTISIFGKKIRKLDDIEDFTYFSNCCYVDGDLDNTTLDNLNKKIRMLVDYDGDFINELSLFVLDDKNSKSYDNCKKICVSLDKILAMKHQSSYISNLKDAIPPISDLSGNILIIPKKSIAYNDLVDFCCYFNKARAKIILFIVVGGDK